MRAYLIVVFHVRQQHVTKMSFTQDDDMIDAFSAIEPISRSAYPFCLGSAVTLVDHEYPLIGVFGRRRPQPLGILAGQIGHHVDAAMRFQIVCSGRIPARRPAPLPALARARPSPCCSEI